MARRRRHVSVLGVTPLVELAGALGVARARLLRGTGLTVERLADPAAQVAWASERALVGNLLAAHDDPALGLRAGEAYHLSAFGLLGAAVAEAPTGRDVIRLFVEHVAHTYTPFEVTLVDDGGHGRVCFLGGRDLGPLRRFYLDRDLAFSVAIARTLLPGAWRQLVTGVDLDYPAPPEAARYRAALGVPVRFGQPVAALRVESGRDIRRDGASALALRVLEGQLRGERRAAARDDALPARLRRRLATTLAARAVLPTLEDLAGDEGQTSRTLRRRLAAAGVSYRALVEDVRRDLAAHYLIEQGLPIAEVAARLAYAEPAAFIRAFRRWHGTTPRAFVRARPRARPRGSQPRRSSSSRLRA